MTDIERVGMTAAEFEAAETTIERGIETFVEVGEALLAIREGRGYRHANYGTFEDYCRDRWSMSREHGRRLIGAAQVMNAMPPMGGVAPPGTERQARALVRVLRQEGPEAAATVWQEAVATAPEGKVTAAHVAQVAEEHMDQAGTKQLRTLRIVEPAPAAGPYKGREAVRARRERISQMASEGYREEAIAKDVGMSLEAVRHFMYESGIPTISRKIGRARALDANKIMEGIVATANPADDAVGALDWTALDESLFPDWERRLNDAIRVLTTLRNRITRRRGIA